jgi:hypothetical protein
MHDGTKPMDPSELPEARHHQDGVEDSVPSPLAERRAAPR